MAGICAQRTARPDVKRPSDHNCGRRSLCGTVVRIDCRRRGRAGSYRWDGLIERRGANAALPDILMALPSCDRPSDFSRPRGARFTDLARAFDGARGSW
jgi:hypothetical protein